MQVNKQNIQRPRLIEPFLDKELTPSNNFVTYIDCTTKSSNVVHKKGDVTSDSHNIKKSLNLGNDKHSNLIRIGKRMKKMQREVRLLSQSGADFRSTQLWSDMRDLNKIRTAMRAS